MKYPYLKNKLKIAQKNKRLFVKSDRCMLYCLKCVNKVLNLLGDGVDATYVLNVLSYVMGHFWKVFVVYEVGRIGSWYRD